MARDPTKAEIERLTKQWSGEFKDNAQELIKRILDLIDKGMGAADAVNKAYSDSDFAAKNRTALNDSLFKAAALGAGIAPAIITSKKAAIVEKINTLPWAPDRMPLSTRLHGTDATMKALIGDVIKQNMENGTNMVKLSRELYDGYNYGKVIQTAELPAYLRRLRYYSKKTMSMGLQPDIQTTYKYNKAIQRAEKLIDGMADNDAPNKALKAAYKNLLDAAQGFSEKALEKAAYVATQERSRFFAERIARTEIARAWADGFFAKTYNDPDVIAYRWRLSSRHPNFDICDLHAQVNLYGLGAGVYPKSKMPPQPAHPHCTCHLEEVFSGEIEQGADMEDAHLEAAGRRWLKSLDEDQQRDLLGPAGVKALKEGGDWRNYVKNWQGHSDPGARLSKEDVTPVKKSDPQQQTPDVPSDIMKSKTYQPLNNVTAATEWARQNLPIDYVEFKGFAPELADSINAMLQSLYDRYPEMSGRTKFLGTAQDRNRQYLARRVEQSLEEYRKQFAGKTPPWGEDQYRRAAEKNFKPKPVPANTMAQSSGNQWGPQEGIGFNQAFAKDLAKITDATTRSVKTGFHPQGTEDPVSVLTHEFGHQVDNLIKEHDLRRELQDLFEKFRSEALNSRKGSQYYRETLSEYAGKNSGEFVAEGFAEYIHNPKPREWATAIGEAIERAIGTIRAKGGSKP